MWREKARQLFPELHADLEQESYSIYSLFFDLVPMALQAHDAADSQLLQRIYGFAEWCFSQKEEDLWNSAGVAFYEDLFDEDQRWEAVIPWLSKEIVKGCWTLWEFRLSPERFERLRSLIQAHHNIVIGKRQAGPRQDKFQSGEGI